MSCIGRLGRGIALLRRNGRYDSFVALSSTCGARHIALLILRQCVLLAEDPFHAGHRLGVKFPLDLAGIHFGWLESYFVLDQWGSVSAS